LSADPPDPKTNSYGVMALRCGTEEARYCLELQFIDIDIDVEVQHRVVN
jgi:hypothetical protein